MVSEKNKIGYGSPTPGFSTEVAGAPLSVPGGNDGSNPAARETMPAVSTDVEHETPGLSPEQQQRVDATAGTDRQIKTIQDWMDAEEHRPETDEERRVRERKEKSKRIIGAVSDGISALSNLYFTSQYAPNMYNHEGSSMTKAVDERLNRLKAERERKRDQYMNFALKLGDLENQRAGTLRELEALQERQRLAREKANREQKAFDFEQTLWDDKKREQKGKADTAEQKAITAGAEADAAPEIWEDKKALGKAKIKTEGSKVLRNRAGASADYARGASYGSKKHHFRGKEYLSEKDYTKDVTEAARKYNERHMEEVEEDDGMGGKKKVRKYKDGFVPVVTERKNGRATVPRKPEEYAGELENRLAEEERQNNDNTPPSRRNNNDNTPPSRR